MIQLLVLTVVIFCQVSNGFILHQDLINAMAHDFGNNAGTGAVFNTGGAHGSVTNIGGDGGSNTVTHVNSPRGQGGYFGVGGLAAFGAQLQKDLKDVQQPPVTTGVVNFKNNNNGDGNNNNNDAVQRDIIGDPFYDSSSYWAQVLYECCFPY